jgi:hypothetical protein
MIASPERPRPGPRLTRREFVLLLAAAVPLWRVAVIDVPAAPLFLAQGPRGIWGVARNAETGAAVFAAGYRGLHGVARHPDPGEA